MKIDKFQGVFTALVTPFNDGQVDLISLRRLVRRQADAGIESFVVNGTTGESPTLKRQEVKEIYELVRQEVGSRATIVLGTGLNCTRSTIEFSRQAEDWGADGLLVVTPYYNRPPQEGLYAHFSAVADAVSIPIILYNVPSRTGTSISIETMKSLAGKETVVGIKEATGDIELGRQIVGECGPSFLLTSGDDFSCMELTLAGARGVISVVSHLIPKEMGLLMSQAIDGKERSRESYLVYSDLLKALYCESNPIGVKMALFKMGIIASPELRLPLITMSEQGSKRVETALRSLRLI